MKLPATVLRALLLVSLCAAAAPPARGQGEVAVLGFDPGKMQRTLTVSGRGSVSLAPELARVTIGVRTDDDDAADAVAANNRQAQALVDKLRELGIAARDVRTTGFSVQPQTKWGPKRENLGTQYVVNNSVATTLRDLDQVGKVLNAAVKAGANTIHGVEFDVADRATAEAQALAAAVREARRRAEVAATAAGVELGEVLTLDTVAGGRSPVPHMAMARSASADVPISPGQMDVAVEVTVVYEIR